MKKIIILFATWLISVLTVQAQTLELTLSEALKLANENNRSLKIQRLEQNLAGEKTKETRGNLLPSIRINSSYSYYFDRQVIFMPGSFIGNYQQPVSDLSVGGKNSIYNSLDFYQPIIAEPLRNQLSAAKTHQEMQKTITSDTKYSLIFDISIHYYQLLLNRAIRKVYEQSLDYNMQSFTDSKMLFRQGKALSVDTLQNYIRTENIKTNLSHIKNQYDILLLELKNKIGLQNEKQIVLIDSLMFDISLEQLPSDEKFYLNSLDARPDIKLHLLNVELNKSKLKEARSYRIPTLAAVGQFIAQTQADNLKNDDYNWPRTSYAGLQLSFPLMNGNKVNSKIKQSKIILHQSQIKLDDTKENAKTEVLSIKSKLNEAIEKLYVNEKIVQSANKSYNIISNRYGQGLSNRLELTDAELSLSQAKLSYIQTVFDIKTTKLLLDRATGSLTINDGN